jgi:hypothetical protein
MGNLLDADLRSALENIASALFPFSLWIQEKDTRFPPPKLDAPWRAGGKQLTLNHASYVACDATLPNTLPIMPTRLKLLSYSAGRELLYSSAVPYWIAELSQGHFSLR